MRSIISALFLISISTLALAAENPAEFSGKHYRGTGDLEYLQLLDTSARFMDPDPQMQNLSMLYTPKWNGFVEGPTWDAWWIQNSYGTTLAALPLLREPFVTFLQNANDLWFAKIGDGKTKGMHDWVGPDGCLCDAANLTQVYYRQGDGRVDIHDWAMEFTAAGVLMQAEELLIDRDAKKREHYLPLLHRSMAFIESRRDPKNDLFLAGPAANLLAPSYAGYKKPDGTYGKAYLTALSITYIGALDRMIELEKMEKDDAMVAKYRAQRDAAMRGLARLVEPEGYFIRSVDPDGVKHGVFGAKQHGYLETSPNHDAIALHIVSDDQARKIYKKIKSIPQLRPHAFILPNYPAYDDMYTDQHDIWAYGTWVNGGHWSTCEGRMILAYSHLNEFEDIRASMHQLMKFVKSFRMDNPLTNMGDDVYQPKEPINLCYDTFAPAFAMMRGLYEYNYTADTLTLVPHIPSTISAIEQRDPVRWGDKKLFIDTFGTGPITAVMIDGKPFSDFTADHVTLAYDPLPPNPQIDILRGGATSKRTGVTFSQAMPTDSPRAHRLMRFINEMDAAGFADRYETAHARLAVDADRVTKQLHLPPLPEASRAAAERSYRDTADNLYIGLEQLMLHSYATAHDPVKQQIFAIWNK